MTGQFSTIERIPVRSSNLRSVGYDGWSRLLEIEFHGGRVYRYSGVPGSIYTGLMRAPSLGHFFAETIRDHYPCQRLE